MYYCTGWKEKNYYYYMHPTIKTITKGEQFKSWWLENPKVKKVRG
jgi:hypothetical protein